MSDAWDADEDIDSGTDVEFPSGKATPVVLGVIEENGAADRRDSHKSESIVDEDESEEESDAGSVEGTESEADDDRIDHIVVDFTADDQNNILDKVSANSSNELSL